MDMAELPSEVAQMDEETLVYLVTVLAMKHPEDYEEAKQMREAKNNSEIRF